jgi:hypothetical protein
MFPSLSNTLINYFKRIIIVSIVFLSTGVSAQTLPTITSFTPLTGNVGVTVTITGTNFNTTAANNIVFFGATKATVSTATATSLTVTVPAGATYGPLTLVDLSIYKTISSKKFFTPTFSPAKGILTPADFSTEQSFSTGTTEPNKIAATGDLDGDGKPDIIIADDGGKKTLILRNTGGNGTASFETALTITTSGNQTSLNVGDIDGDGKLDLVEVDKTNSSFVSIYLNTTVAIGSISFSAATNLITGANNHKLRNVAISDLDGDGKADIAVVNNEGNVLLYRNTGSVGTVSFAAKVEYAAGTGPQGIMIGDIDSDGLPDLAITNADGGGTSVRVLRNTSTSGTLSFVNSGNFTTGGGPYDLALGDLDGDGKLDIATVNHGGQNVSVLLNTSASGTVSFATKTDFAIGKSALKIAIGDLNGDGKLDVVVTQGGAAVSILTNTTTTAGTVTFAPKIDVLSTGSSLQAIIGDLDGDGKTDFATGGSKKIIVFHNANPLENADLEALSISGDGTLSPTFTPSTTAYTAIVSNAITSISVTPTQITSNATATIQVRVNAGSYVAVASASASDPLVLIVGSNTIDVKVTSPNGNTIKNYVITVTREMPVPSYIVSGAGTAAVNGVYIYFGKNSQGDRIWNYNSYYLSSYYGEAYIGTSPNNSYSGKQYSVYSSDTDPTKWNMSTSSGSSPAPIIELAAPKVSYASSTLIENSADDGSISGVTTITHNNYTGATFTGTDGEDFVTTGKAVVTGVPTGLTAVIIRNNNLQLTFSLTGNASANSTDISNLNITFQNSAFSDSDAANTINYNTNLSINFIQQINVGSGQTYTTIQSAVNAAGNGDVLLLAAETFTEQNITITDKSLKIIGVSPVSTIIQAHAVAGSATDRVFNITHSSYAETNFNSFEKLTIRHGNSARKAGGLYGQNTTIRLKDCSIESNSTTTPVNAGYFGDGGGGIQLVNSNLKAENCTFYNNHHISSYKTDLMGGGAIAFFPDAQVNYMEITNSTFSGNSSGAHGGAIMNVPTITNDIRITNSTFVGNSAPYGGAYMQMGSSANPQPIFLINSLFYGNTAPLGGTQLYSDQATNWTVNNSLIESTSAGQLAGVYADCIIGVDPLLGALADNGGFTKTYSIGLGSPAINSGTTTGLSLDQRGFNIFGVRDIGSYEYATPSSNADLSAMSISSGTLSPVFASGTTAYTATVSNATTSITLTPTKAEVNATITINGVSVTSGDASGAIALNLGSNTITTIVVAQDASTKTYTATVTRLIANQTITALATSICDGNSTSINVASSETGVSYYLRNNANNSIIAGPTAGTGSAIALNTGAITSTTIYNVNGLIPGGSLALKLDGINDYVSCANSAAVNLTNNFTIEAWINYTVGGYQRIYSRGAPGGFGFGMSGGGFIFTTYNRQDYVTSTVNLTSGTWYHIALVFDSSNDANFYVNGSLVETVAGNSPAISVGASAYIGGASFGQYFKGSIDELRVWNTSKTQAQIQNNMNLPLFGNEANLVAYYNFENGTGSTTLTDIAGGDNNGSLTNMNPATDWVTSPNGGVSTSTQMSNTSTVTVTAAPVITSFTPTSAAAGTTVTFTGTGFTGASAVSFGGIATTSFTVVSSTSITAVVASGISGNASITTSCGTGTKTGFTHLSSNADLSAMSNSTGTLSPAFASGTTAYTATVSNGITGITLTPTRSEANATITVNGTAVTSGTASGNIALSVGSNTITTVVTAQDGSSTKTYTVIVTREKQNQTITFPALANKTTADTDYEPGATTDSGLPIRYTSSNTAVATVYQDNTDGNKWKIKIQGSGQTDIIAIQDGNSTYNSESFLRLLTVGTPLPVSLVSYDAKLNTNGTVQLNWLTTSETNNSYFEIQRSVDGKSFTKIGKVTGAGNSTKEIRYTFTDLLPLEGNNYYQLVQYDKDGKRKELGVRTVKVSFEDSQIMVYPNPSNGVVNVRFDVNSYQKVELIDLTGKVLQIKTIGKQENTISFDISELSAGVYNIRLIGEGKLTTKQVVKQ